MYTVMTILSLWVASLISVGIYEHHKGESAIMAEWTTEKLKASMVENKVLTNKSIIEEQYQIDMGNVASIYEKRINDEENKTNTIIASHSRGLFVHTTGPCVNSTSSTAPSATGNNATSTTRLSTTTVDFLLKLGQNADSIANRLTACQEIIKQDREASKKYAESIKQLH